MPKTTNRKSNNDFLKEQGLIAQLKVERGARRYAQDIIATVREPLVVLDVDLRVILVNKAFYRTFKANPEETIGRFIYDLGNRQWNILELRQLLEDILPKNNSFENFKVEHNFETIGQKIMLLNARRIPQPPAQPKIILLAIEDITEHKKIEHMTTMNLAILESNKAKDDFLNIAAHDLRTPIGEIRANIEMILGGDYGEIPSKIKTSLQDINKANLNLIKMVDDFLTVARIEKSKITITPHPTDLVPILNFLTEQIKPLVEKRGLKFDYEIPAELPQAMADPNKIPEVVNNLLDNAIKFTDRGSISLMASVKENSVVVKIMDTGIGIIQERQKDIFQKYTQANAGRRIAHGKGTGLGLGLYISRLIIEGCGGKIWVKSKPDKGSAFYFSLPIAKK